MCVTELVMSSLENEKTAGRQRLIISSNLVG